MPRSYHRKPPERCFLCGVPIQKRRRNKNYCSAACKQAMFRIRVKVKKMAVASNL